MQSPAPKAAWEYAAVVLTVIAGVAAFAKWPLGWLRRWLRRDFQAAVMDAVDARSRDLRTVIEREFADEFKARAVTAATAVANVARMTTAQAAIEAHGLILREVPEMSAALNSVSGTLDRLDKTLGEMSRHQMTQGTELGRVTGFIEGVERRRQGRRKNDPPLHEDGG